MRLRVCIVAGLIVTLAACGESPSANTPSTSDTVSPTSSTGESDTIALDPLGTDLAEHGVLRYEFSSTMTIDGPSGQGARYDGEVSVVPPATAVRASGIVGEFAVYLTEAESYSQYEGQPWRRLPPDHVWQWPSNGPIPDYATAGTIARLTIDQGVDTRVDETLDGDDVIHLTSTIPGGLAVELWIRPDGVVRRVIVREEQHDEVVTCEWTMHRVNGDFTLTPPVVDESDDDDPRPRDGATPQPD